jgi:hypothetical protein
MFLAGRCVVSMLREPQDEARAGRRGKGKQEKIEKTSDHN